MKKFLYWLAWLFIILLSPVLLLGSIAGILAFAFIMSLKATYQLLLKWAEYIE